jgi:ethanolamine ammonia-lyase small subunit
MSELVRPLSHFTAARIGLRSTGQSLATADALDLARDHALARDAVHAPFDMQALAEVLAACGHSTCKVRSMARDRAEYLRRPDLGRRLDPASRPALQDGPGGALTVVVADGLSARAARHAPSLLRHLALLEPRRWRGVPVVLASEARVALGDDIGGVKGSPLVLMLIGERPGLSSHDILGAYLTHAPRPGRTDAERNCISNIRPDGLDFPAAAWKIHWLVEAALTRGITGIDLKDESGSPPLHITSTGDNIPP